VSDFRYRIIQYTPSTGVRVGSPLRAPDIAVATPLNDLSTFSGMLYGDSGAVTAPAEFAVEVSNDGGLTWTEPPNMRFAMIGDDNNMLSAELPSTTAVSMAWQLRKALVYATGGQPLDADGRRSWTNYSAGGIMKQLLQEAQARGVLTWMDISTFSSATDSAGVAWPDIFSTSHNIGTTLDTVLNNLADAGVCDWVLQGRSLRLYKPDTFMAPASTGVVLREGQDFTEAGTKRTLEDLASRNLIRGDNGAELIVVDGTAAVPWGAWEVYTTASGSTDTTSLGLLADLGTARSSQPRSQRTYTVYPNVTPTCPKPFFDYKLGSTIEVRAGKVNEPNLRVRQLTITGGSEKPVLVTLVVGDRILERELRAARRLQGLAGGAAGAGSSGTTPTPVKDILAPSPPTTLVTSSSAVQIGDTYIADITASWTAPTTNTNGTPLTDLDKYEVQYARGTTPTNWQPGGSTQSTVIVLNSLAPNVIYTVRVRAVDKAGNVSTWLTSGNVTTAADSTAPNTPSTPTVGNYLGTLRVTWDGKDSGGNPMPADWRNTEVHASSVSATFTPDATTLKGGFFKAGGTFQITDFGYGTTVWVRLVAVDQSGNRSAPSTAASGIPQQIVDGDVGNIAANKIITGSLQASARIIAGIDGARRAELTGTGFYAYDPGPDNDVTDPVISLGTASNDYFTVMSGGVAVAGISSAGDGSFSTLSVAGFVDSDLDGVPDSPQPDDTDPNAGFRIYGKEFIEWLDERPRGLVSWEVFGADSASVAVETGFGEIGGLLYPDRVYRLSFRANYEVTTTTGQVDWRIRFTKSTDASTDAASPTVTSSQIMLSQTGEGTTGRDHAWTDFMLFTTGETIPKNYRFLLTFNATGATNAQVWAYGAGVASLNPTPDTAGVTMILEDIGPAEISQSGAYNTGGGTSKPPVTTTKTWTATGTGSYRGDGSKRTDTTDGVQGYNSANGDQRAAFIFPNTITSTITGSTIKKIEVYLYANHWYYNSGGTALIKVHGLTSVPASAPTMTTAVSSANWPKPGGRWVTLPSSFHAGFLAGTYKGFGVGPSGGTNLLYYGRFNGSGASSSKPQIRITYTK